MVAAGREAMWAMVGMILTSAKRVGLRSYVHHALLGYLLSMRICCALMNLNRALFADGLKSWDMTGPTSGRLPITIGRGKSKTWNYISTATATAAGFASCPMGHGDTPTRSNGILPIRPRW